MLNPVKPPFAISGAGASASSGTVVFSNSNNVSFGQNGNTITATATFAGGNFSGGISTNGNTSGNTGFATDRLCLIGGNNITLSGSTNGGSMSLTISGANVGGAQTGISGIQVSDTTYTSGTVTFRNANGISFGSSGANGVSASHNALTSQSTQYIAMTLGGNTAGTTTFHATNNASLFFNGGNGITLSGNGSTVTISGITQSVQTQGITGDQLSIGVSTGGNTAGNTTVNSGNRIVFVGSNGITLSQGTGAGSTTITISGVTTAAQTNQSAIKGLGVSNTGNTLGNTGISTGIDWVFAASGAITASQSTAGGGPNTVWYSVAAQTNQSAGIYALGNTTGQSSSSTYDARTLSVEGAGIVSVGWSNSSLRISATQSNQAVSNSAGSFTFQTLNFSNANNVTWGTSAGGIVTASVAAPGAAAENNWFTLTGAAAGNVVGNSSASGSTIQLSAVNLTLSGTNNSVIGISAPATSSLSATGWASISVNGSTISIGASTTANLYAVGNTFGTSSGTADIQTISISAGSGLQVAASNSGWVIGQKPCGFYEAFQGELKTSQAIPSGNISQVMQFCLPYPITAQFIRFPIALTTNSTTLSTLGSSANMSATVATTWNAVIYKMGDGASSRSLVSVAKASATWGMLNSISVAANGTQYSVTQSLVGAVEGAAFTSSTQYSISNTNYSYTTNQIFTNFSGSRFLDLNMTDSLSAGPYWMIVGWSSSTASNSARVSAATNCNLGFSGMYGDTASNIAFGIMGSTNQSSGNMVGAGSFSTAGGGTTSILPISAITSTASHYRPYFQIAGSA